jgi:hypothetical protein
LAKLQENAKYYLLLKEHQGIVNTEKKWNNFSQKDKEKELEPRVGPEFLINKMMQSK